MITPTKYLHVRFLNEENKDKMELKVSVPKDEYASGTWGDMRITSSQHNGQRSAIVEINRQQIGQVYLNDAPTGVTGPFYHAELKFPFYNVESFGLFREALESVFGETIEQNQLIVNTSNFLKHSPLATMSGITATPDQEEHLKTIVRDPLQYNDHLHQTLTEINEVRQSGVLKVNHRNHTRMNYEVTVHDELGLCINSVSTEADEFIQPIWMDFDLDVGQVFFNHPLFEGEAFKHPGHPRYRNPSIRLVDNFNSLLPKGTRGRQHWNTTLLAAQLTALIDQAYEKVKKGLTAHATHDKYVLKNNPPFGEYLDLAALGGESVFFEANDEGTVWSAYLGKEHLADIKEGEVGLNIYIRTGDQHLTLRGQLEQIFRSMKLSFA